MVNYVVAYEEGPIHSSIIIKRLKLVKTTEN